MLNEKKFVACIGSRTLACDEQAMNQARAMGAYLVSTGWTIKTGAAEGADQAFAEGGAMINPGRVILYLPWAEYTDRNGNERGYNTQWVRHMEKEGCSIRVYSKWNHLAAKESVDHFHPNSDGLKGGARSLHARNWLIMHDNFEASDEDCRVSRVVAWPGKELGGTGQGLRIAEDMEPSPATFRMDDPATRAKVVDTVKDFFATLAAKVTG